MPKQAAFADSTTAPADHPGASLSTPAGLDGILPFETDLDAFEDTMEELSAYVLLLEVYLEQESRSGAPSGIARILRRIAYELGAIHTTVRRDLGRLHPRAAPRNGPSGLLFALVEHIEPMVAKAWHEAGRPVPAGSPGAWPEPFRSDLSRVATTYAQMVLARLDGSDDRLEAGSLLPWIGSVIRDELIQTDTAATRPAAIRDQAIIDCIRRGETVDDIAHALGLSTTTVDQALRRLRPVLSANHQA